MASQLEFFDLSALGPLGPRQPARPHRWFLALRPSEADTIAAFARSEARSHHPVGFVHPDSLHISISFVGDAADIDDRLVAAARAAGAAVRRGCFDVVFDRLQTFNGKTPYPVVLTCRQGLQDISNLRGLVANALERFGFHPSQKPITPHLTLWYDKGRIAQRDLAHPFKWTVRDFCLVHSVYGKGRHDLPGRWPLIDSV